MTRKRSDDDEIINIEEITPRTKILYLTKDYLKNRREPESIGD